MDGIGQLLGIVGGVLGVLAALAGALVYVKGSYTAARFEALRKDVADHQARESRHTVEIKELNTKVEALQGENKVLRELSTSRAAVEALAHALDEHNHTMLIVNQKNHEALMANNEKNHIEMMGALHQFTEAIKEQSHD